MLFIDHQFGLMAGARDFSSLAEYRSNVVGLVLRNVPINANRRVVAHPFGTAKGIQTEAWS